ncbi:MAG: PAS domain-containing protein [Pedobacter agri]
MMKVNELWLSRDESTRLATLSRYKTVCSPSEHALEDFAQLACEIFDLPMCVISLIDQDKVYLKACVGFTGLKSLPRTESLLGRLLPSNQVTIVDSHEETLQFSGLLNTTILFCAGVALITPDGHNIGSLWLMNDQSTDFELKKQSLLMKFEQVLIDRMGLWLVAAEDAAMRIQNVKLVSENERVVEKISHLMDYHQEISNANNVLEGVLDSFEMIFQQAPIAMGICSGADKNIWQANAMMEKSFGINIIGQRLHHLIVEINGDDFEKVVNDTYQQAKPFQAKEAKLFIDLPGEKKHIYANLSLQPVGRMGDEPDNIMFIIDNVTEQVFEKQVMEEANNVLVNAIEDTDMGYTIVEFATGNMNANARLKQNYGYAPFEAFNYDDLFAAMLPEYRSDIKAAVEKAIVNRSIYQSEYQVRWRDGSVHWIRGYGKPIYDANGKASHIIGFNKIISK